MNTLTKIRQFIIRRAQKYLLAILVAIALAACGGSSKNSSSKRLVFDYSAPSEIGDGWQVGSLADEGFDTQKVTEMMGGILNGAYPNIDSVAIARNNKLLFYWYADRDLTGVDSTAGNRDIERHTMQSTSKSFTSALIGIAIDQGYVASTQVRFVDLLNYANYENWDARKAEMTLEDVLTMRLGLSWDEWTAPYGSQQNSLTALQATNQDWTKALLDLPMTHMPGTVFTYNTAASIALGQALEDSTGMPMESYAQTYLFQPMQIGSASWVHTPTGLPNGGSGLFLTTRDLLKFGQLYLSGGEWLGQQLISEDWIGDTVIRRVDISAIANYSEAYGFQWWLDDFAYKGQTIESWTTRGLGGQFMFVIPSLDLVVAFTGSNYFDTRYLAVIDRIMRSYILGAIE